MDADADDLFVPQAGALVLRGPAGAEELLLVTAYGSDALGLPKGLIDPGFTAAETAVAELLEEAGVVGRAGAEVGSYEYEKWGKTRRVRVFRVEALAEHAAWPEQVVRERRWVPFAAAAAMVREPGLARLLAELHARNVAGGR